jgi:hypothetical protein
LFSTKRINDKNEMLLASISTRLYEAKMSNPVLFFKAMRPTNLLLKYRRRLECLAVKA